MADQLRRCDRSSTDFANFDAATVQQVGITERQETDGTGEGFGRRVDEFAVVSSSGERNTLIAGGNGGFSHDVLT